VFLSNEFLYLSVALITLGLVFPAYINLDKSKRLINPSIFWFWAVVVQFLSSAFFAAYPILGAAALSLGSTLQLLVNVLLIYLFRSLNRKVEPKTMLWAAVGIAAYWIFYDHEDFIHRVIISTSMLIILSLWQIYELAQSLKNLGQCTLFF